MTEPQARALLILREHGPMMPHQFAVHMWPDSTGWQKNHRVGRGSTRGGGMPSAAGGYLGKLKKMGWVNWRWDKRTGHGQYSLSNEGAKALAEKRKVAA